MWPLKTLSKKANSEKGFTLVEMAIVIIIMGFLIGSIAQAYVQWQTWQRVQTTNDNIADAKVAVENFLEQFGRYPCPASLQASRNNGSDNYGVEPDAAFDCENQLAANGYNTDGIAGNDMFVVAGARDTRFLEPSTGTENPAGDAVLPSVRIGALPFRMLGIDEAVAYDGYRNRLYYAVTEHLASAASFEQSTGAIDIQDNGGDSYTSNAGESHYIIFSAGANGLGAFNLEGVQSGCPGVVANENENCDLDDAIFLFDEYSTSGDNNNLDDVIAFGFSEAPKWQRPQGGDLNDGVLYKNLGFGPNASEDPDEELDVSGVIRVQDNPDTLDYEEGKVRANALCSFNDPDDPDCFDISSIAGSLDDGEGMECAGENEFITGISNNAPTCEVVSIGCRSNQIIVGINSNGTLNCGEAPESCPTQSITMCGENRTLPASGSGTDITLTAGSNVGNLYTEEWTCDDGRWEQEDTYGLCECTPRTTDQRFNVSCAAPSHCGDRYTGTMDIETRYECPSGDTIVDDVIRDDCVCVETEGDDRNWSCGEWWINRWVLDDPAPDGYEYNTGEVTAYSRHVCDGEYCSGWIERSSNCGCEDSGTWDEERACSNGVPSPAAEIHTRQFVCNGGEGLGRYGRVETINVDTDACVCSEGTVNGPVRDCTDGRIPRDGFSGVPTLITTSWDGTSCTSSTADAGPETDYCMEPPPLSCAWTVRTGAVPIAASAALRDGDPCDCAEDTNNPPCERLGQSYQCSCQVN